MNLIRSIAVALAVVATNSVAQTNFLYDQQSAVEGAFAENEGLIVADQPMGQSFTPSLDSVGFIRIRLSDLGPGNGVGSTVALNLRSNSITGPVLATTGSSFFEDGFGGPGNPGYRDFFFSTPVVVLPGVTYYFQPVLESGGGMGMASDVNYGYAGGTASGTR